MCQNNGGNKRSEVVGTKERVYKLHQEREYRLNDQRNHKKRWLYPQRCDDCSPAIYVKERL